MRLFLLMFTVCSTMLAGSAIIAVLTLGYDTLIPILIAAAVGALVAVPVAWIITKRIKALG